MLHVVKQSACVWESCLTFQLITDLEVEAAHKFNLDFFYDRLLLTLKSCIATWMSFVNY